MPQSEIAPLPAGQKKTIRFNKPDSNETVLQKPMPPKPIPDGYNTAMSYVGFLKFVGWICIVAGVVIGVSINLGYSPLFA